jgi:hypothetical protein
MLWWGESRNDLLTAVSAVVRAKCPLRRLQFVPKAINSRWSVLAGLSPFGL